MNQQAQAGNLEAALRPFASRWEALRYGLLQTLVLGALVGWAALPLGRVLALQWWGQSVLATVERHVQRQSAGDGATVYCPVLSYEYRGVLRKVVGGPCGMHPDGLPGSTRWLKIDPDVASHIGYAEGGRRWLFPGLYLGLGLLGALILHRFVRLCWFGARMPDTVAPESKPCP